MRGVVSDKHTSTMDGKKRWWKGGRAEILLVEKLVNLSVFDYFHPPLLVIVPVPFPFINTHYAR